MTVDTAAKRSSGAQGSATGTVAIVDDDEAVRDSLCLLLGLHGYRVECFASVAEYGRSLAPGEAAGCLILDQHLPVATGLDFLASRAGRALRLPVILLTGRGDPGLRARARELGVAHYLEKPASEAAILRAVRASLGDDA